MTPVNLTHLDHRGRARMVDVSAKPETVRTAVAAGRLTMKSATAALLRRGRLAKGDALAAARLAGIQAAKRVPDLVPLAHSISLTDCRVDLKVESRSVEIIATVRAVGRTGVELEALAAVLGAGLTLYAMAKAVDRGMMLTHVRLLEKRGGRSGIWRRRVGAGLAPARRFR